MPSVRAQHSFGCTTPTTPTPIMQFKALASIVALSALISVNARPTTNDICLKICAPQELSCADGWHSQKVGDYCNTCCLDQESSPSQSRQSQGPADLRKYLLLPLYKYGPLMDGMHPVGYLRV
ncbi:hypothetical protein MSAN_02063200 [Mycena sanguinolenta]|uniref:Uncharacterized protein n=1 Tax=Mycena sanguinolenta TaxID=230812 RepID=A0A8H7CMR1_9AGAR|nr:hypothetical protein MSAN_02063200 [Mycena sanguinolenta]